MPRKTGESAIKKLQDFMILSGLVGAVSLSSGTPNGDNLVAEPLPPAAKPISKDCMALLNLLSPLDPNKEQPAPVQEKVEDIQNLAKSKGSQPVIAITELSSVEPYEQFTGLPMSRNFPRVGHFVVLSAEFNPPLLNDGITSGNISTDPASLPSMPAEEVGGQISLIDVDRASEISPNVHVYNYSSRAAQCN